MLSPRCAWPPEAKPFVQRMRCHAACCTSLCIAVRSIGNIGPLLSKEYPSCWKKYKTCSKTLTQARLTACPAVLARPCQGTGSLQAARSGPLMLSSFLLSASRCSGLSLS